MHFINVSEVCFMVTVFKLLWSARDTVGSEVKSVSKVDEALHIIKIERK